MALSDIVTKLSAVNKNPVLERAFKTFVEVTAAQAALYSTVVPNTPGVKTSAAVSGGATVLSVAWTLVVQWALHVKSAKLDALAKAIDDAVDARLAAQAAQAKAAEPAPAPATPAA